MTLRVIAYTPGELHNAEHHEIVVAFAEGVRKVGQHVEIRDVNDYQPSHIAIVFGVGKKAVPASYARGEIIRRQQLAGALTLILEKGYINRDLYYAAGWNGLNGRANFMNTGMPPDRWLALGKRLKPSKIGGKTILVVGQVPSDASVQHVDFINWCSTTVFKLRKLVPASIEIVFRPHPLAVNRTPTILHARRSTRPLEDDLAEAKAVVTFNSNTGVDAVLAGVPVYAEDPGSMVYNIASKALSRMTYPSNDQLQRWAYDIAYTQWTADEMREGLPWQHLTRKLPGS